MGNEDFIFLRILFICFFLCSVYGLASRGVLIYCCFCPEDKMWPCRVVWLASCRFLYRFLLFFDRSGSYVSVWLS